ncbi:hypothetical protein B484DRAFT_457419 [Ochromonadaceae sp. CCMP2298]|nr:hypothetical protein B484DRAFT_457419 [Ochromonadaceae sp. CCMP2298]|mmetsp:Transcript_10535/g.23396  ORF Transcript_10535/g.23396 Transcript_10535/m.23396 type:complete len:145 (+) Transcript_10535:154-588(+)
MPRLDQRTLATVRALLLAVVLIISLGNVAFAVHEWEQLPKRQGNLRRPRAAVMARILDFEDGPFRAHTELPRKVFNYVLGLIRPLICGETGRRRRTRAGATCRLRLCSSCTSGCCAAPRRSIWSGVAWPPTTRGTMPGDQSPRP